MPLIIQFELISTQIYFLLPSEQFEKILKEKEELFKDILKCTE